MKQFHIANVRDGWGFGLRCANVTGRYTRGVKALPSDPASDRMTRLAGFVTYLVISLPVFLDAVREPERLMSVGFGLGVLALVSYGAAYLYFTGEAFETLPRRALLVFFGHQVLTASVAVAAMPERALMAILYIILVPTGVYLLSVGPLWVLIGLQTVWTGFSGARNAESASSVAPISLAFLGFQLFALYSTRATILEAEARAELDEANTELRATRALLAESSRVAERMRLARELHDVIGHHLTALGMQLELTRHLSEGKVHTQVEKAQQLSKDLLAEVRQVVSRTRDGAALDLTRALEALVENVPAPHIHLDIPEGLVLEDPSHAQILLRCVQEMITNTVRHAKAENLRIALHETPDGIRVQAEDDGRGANAVQAGNGLQGMRERLESCGGDLHIDSSPGAGFRLDVRLPYPAVSETPAGAR